MVSISSFTSLPFILALHMWATLPHFNISSTFHLLFCQAISSFVLFLAHSSTPGLAISSFQGHSWLFQLFSFLPSRYVSHATENSKSVSGLWPARILEVSGPQLSSSVLPLATLEDVEYWAYEKGCVDSACFLTRSEPSLPGSLSWFHFFCVWQ